MVLTRKQKAFGRAALLLLAALALFCLLPGAARAANIRVCLKTAATDSEFTIEEGIYEVRGGNLAAETLCDAWEGDVVRVVKGAAGFTVYLNDEEAGRSAANVSLLATDDEDCSLSFGGKEYRGSFSVLTNGYVLNVLDLEYYLYGVVGEEIGYNAPEEALRAQAIVARSYAAYYMGGTYYDVLATTSSQVYGGLSAEKAHVSRAVRDAVDDQVLYYDGDLVEAVFSSSAGGYTEDNENVWGGQARPYLRGVPSPYDEGYNNYTWEVSYTPAQLKNLAEAYMKRVNQSGSFGSFVRLEVSYEAAGGGKTVSGRATNATLIGTQGSVSAKNDAIRTMLGLKSTLFKVTAGAASEVDDVDEEMDEVYVLGANGDLERRPVDEVYAVGAGDIVGQLGDLTKAYMRSASGLAAFGGGSGSASAQGVTIKGGGWGHGVGLSQYGAIGMAADGYTAEEILEHYYGGERPRLLQIDDLD